MKISQPKFAVSGYIDAKAHSIQSQVLGGVDRFDQASQANQGDLVVRIHGRRSPRPLQFAIAGGFVATGAGLAAAGWALAAYPGLAAAGLLGLYVAFQAEDHLRQALKAPQWKGPHPHQLGSGPLPASLGQPADQLKQLIQSNLKDFPSSRQVVSLAGHGNHEQVGPLTYAKASQALQGNPVEQVILDTCLGGQLEVLAKLAPWSQFMLASPQPIPAIGLPFDKMFAPDQLDKSPRELASSWVDQAAPITPSLAAWDSDKFRHSLLPALDKLGSQLCTENRAEIRKALRRSKNPDRLPSGRVDLGSFLENLQQAKMRPETLQLARQAREAFQQSLVNQQNDKTLTFHLKRERDDESLPQGWRDFLKAADFRLKPFLFQYALTDIF
ncbi:MAG: hypothetical protein KF760_35380 [Candidatus Eremiobacteraeota bacterium]|nr:hypothetical protein [Candidatus Eremiobacteraeota bacterium]MCW5871132.1 hypothetical protein [Candidatus Eremiobacteraeota bacterium]